MAERLLQAALKRQPVARRPTWIMRQAGRYLPEYRELRRTHAFKALSRSPALAAEVTLLPLRRFPLDAAIVFADIMSPLPALGVDFDFDPGPVLANPIRAPADVARLRTPPAEALAPEVTAALRQVRRELAPETALLGFCGAPWTLAAYLVEGRGVAGFPRLRAFAAEAPDLLGELLAKLADAMADYLVAQARAGADAVQVFDSWAGVLSLADWRRLVRPHLLALLEAVGRAGVPRILFLQNAPHLVDAYAELPTEALGVDWRVDLAAVQRRHPHLAVQGNIDPAILLAGPEATREAAGQMLAQVERHGHIANLGHGILPETPLESVQAFVEAVHGEARPRQAQAEQRERGS